MSHENPFILGVRMSKVKVMRHKKHCRRGSWRFCEFWLFWFEY